MKTLDRDVTVIDPREPEEALMGEFKHVRTIQDAEQAIAESVERRLISGKDVPLVRGFPFGPRGKNARLSRAGGYVAATLHSSIRALAGQHALDIERDHRAHNKGGSAGS